MVSFPLRCPTKSLEELSYKSGPFGRTDASASVPSVRLSATTTACVMSHSIISLSLR